MKLKELLKAINILSDIKDCEVTNIVIDSRKVTKGSLFVAIKGDNFDGHSVAGNALEDGAVAIVTERKLGYTNEIVVEDTRKANALLCSAFFNFPSSKLKLVGVTGTNGKSTIASLLKQSLQYLGHNSGLIGTIQNEIVETEIPSKFTTPEPWDLNVLLDGMVRASCEYVVMEASSQALVQDRLYGLNFEASAFTNLTRDHLDYHKTMEEYFLAKRKLFLNSEKVITNFDDEYGLRLAEEFKDKLISYSGSNDMADYTAKSIEYTANSVRFAISGYNFIGRVKFCIPGYYSVQNALAAFCVLTALGIPKSDAAEAISSVQIIKGRCETLYQGNYTVISDFAHTADGLYQLASSMKPYIDGKLIMLFGCAGDRDAGKRVDMVETVGNMADVIVLTSDNPRTENPKKIIDSLVDTLDKGRKTYYTEPDREKAIKLALSQCDKGDVLLLCGKGHEEYQVMNGYTLYLNEREIVRAYV